VMHYTFAYQTGEKTLTMASRGLGIETDDRGVYRAFGLPPDDYFVLATLGIGPRNSDLHQVTADDVQWAMRQVNSTGQAGPAVPAHWAEMSTYAPTFYPCTAMQSDAAVIPVGAGEERAGVDLQIQLVPTSRITGTVAAPQGVPVEGLQIALIANDRISGLPFSGFSSARTDKNGAFTFPGLMPGRYTVTARVGSPPPGARGGSAPPASAASLFALEDVTVTGSDINVSLAMRPGVAVSGQLVFEGTTPPPASLSGIRVNLGAVQTGNGATLGVPAANADARGRFTFTGVTRGHYRLSASVPGSTPTGGWHLRSAVIGGRDSLDFPAELGNADVDGAVLTFTDRVTELSGTLLDVSGRPAPEYFIIVFPTNRTFWTPQSRRVQQVRPGVDGRFVVRNLPAGEYQIGAVTDVEQGEWYDPAFLQELAASTPITITLAEGDRKVQDIRIAR
jgi:Carboxypeptidase regulatory-like domain